MHIDAQTGPTSLVCGLPYDAVIVGSGTAGLLAAYHLLQARPASRVIIVDAGAGLDTRSLVPASQMVGYGGAGLYLGGRLYLGPATIPALLPVRAHPAMQTILEGQTYADRATEVNALFTRLGAMADVRPVPPGPLADSIAAAQSAGLDYITSYPARLLGASERRAVLENLLGALERSGTTLVFGARVETARRTPDGFEVAVREVTAEPSASTERRIRTRALVLAPGRLGAEWLSATVSALEGTVVPLPTAFGVRMEVPANAYAAFTDVNPDPRLQLALDSDAVVKTYATCPGGEVTAIVRYQTLVATGVPLPLDARHRSTTFAVLVQPGASSRDHMPEAKGLGRAAGSEQSERSGRLAGVPLIASAWRGTDAIARAVNERSPKKLIVQRLADVRNATPTTPGALAANTVRPTCERAEPGALHDLYPAVYWSALNDLLARIERIAPGTDIPDTLVYGPAEERFWLFPTDGSLQTDVPGLFVAGDGPGHSQGVIQAGVAGMLAGAGVARFLS